MQFWRTLFIRGVTTFSLNFWKWQDYKEAFTLSTAFFYFFFVDNALPLLFSREKWLLPCSDRALFCFSRPGGPPEVPLYNFRTAWCYGHQNYTQCIGLSWINLVWNTLKPIFYFFVVKGTWLVFTHYVNTTSYIFPFSKECKRVASLSNENATILVVMNNNRKFVCLFVFVFLLL